MFNTLLNALQLDKLEDKIQALELLAEDDGFVASLATVDLPEIYNALGKAIKSPQLRVNLLSFKILQRLVSEKGVHGNSPIVTFQTVIDKFGDSNEKLRESALKTAQIMFLKVAESGSEQQLHQIENIVVKLFTAKSPKAKETACLLIRNSLQEMQISLKPFVSGVVSLLEDANESVRSEAKMLLIYFGSRCTSPALKHDIEKEFKRLGIRQSTSTQILDHYVMKKSNIVDVGKDPTETPTNFGTSAPVPSSIEFSNLKDLREEIMQYSKIFSEVETEQNWAERDRTLQRVRGILRGKMIQEIDLENLGILVDLILENLSSLRTALLLSAISAVSDFSFISSKMDAFGEQIFTSLLKISGHSKRLIRDAVEFALRTLAESFVYSSKYLNVYRVMMEEKSAMIRKATALSVAVTISKMENVKKSLEKKEILEEIIRKALTDRSEETRKLGRDMYFYYSQWANNGAIFLSTLDNATQKAISKSKPPKPSEYSSPSKGKEAIEVATEQVSHPSPLTSVESSQESKVENFELVIQKLKLKDAAGIDCLLQYLRRKSHFPQEMTAKITSLILDCFQSTDPLTVVSNQNFKILADHGLLTYDNCLVPFLKIYMDDCSEVCQTEIDRFLADLTANHATEDLLILIVNSLSEVSSRTPPHKKSNATKALERNTRDFLFEWIKSLMDSESNDKSNDEFLKSFFSNPQTVRQFINKIIPEMIQHRTILLQTTGAEILKIMHSYAQETFESVLSTFDGEIIREIKEWCNISDPIHDQSAMEICSNGSSENAHEVLNESLPLEFQDISFVSSAGESVNSDQLGETNSIPKIGILEKFVDSKFESTPKRVSVRKEIEELTPKQLKYNDQTTEFQNLISGLNNKSDRINVLGSLYHFSRKNKVHNAQEKTAKFWKESFDVLLQKILELTSASEEIEIQESALILLESIIKNQTAILTNHRVVFNTLFMVRSQGISQLSGAADFALRTLIEVLAPTYTIELLVQFLSNWNIEDPKDEAFEIRKNPFECLYQPYPVVSCLFALKLAISMLEVKETEKVTSETLSHTDPTLRKATYECFVECAVKLSESFWTISKEHLSHPQAKMIAFLYRKQQNIK